MSLNAILHSFTQDVLDQYSPGVLQKAYKDLQFFYTARKQGKDFKQPSFTTVLHRLVYIICRMPATYAVLQKVFAGLSQDLNFAPKTFLDLGCGSGSGLWAAVQQWPSLTHITAIDQDPVIVQHAQNLLGQSGLTLPDIDWKIQPITPPKQTYDIIVLSYVLNELKTLSAEFISNIWPQCTTSLIIIEPGTPQGFQQCLAARQILINQGAHIIAPCGHEQRCPLQNKQDWCHFEQRVHRLPVHQFIKEGTLGYEDEAYSYVVASKIPLPHFNPRIIRPPLKPKGQVVVDVCLPATLDRRIFTKRDPIYKDKKSLKWGDKIPLILKD